jgi:hypothetical protein
MRDSPADLASWYGRATLFAVEQQMAKLGARFARMQEDALRRAARRVFRREGLVVAAVGELARGEWRRVCRAVDRWQR